MPDFVGGDALEIFGSRRTIGGPLVMDSIEFNVSVQDKATCRPGARDPQGT
jgi:hypothetical protein